MWHKTCHKTCHKMCHKCFKKYVTKCVTICVTKCVTKSVTLSKITLSFKRYWEAPLLPRFVQVSKRSKIFIAFLSPFVVSSQVHLTIITRMTCDDLASSYFFHFQCPLTLIDTFLSDWHHHSTHTIKKISKLPRQEMKKKTEFVTLNVKACLSVTVWHLSWAKSVKAC